MVEKYKISWIRYGDDLEQLATKIKRSRAKFNAVIGIERGGLPVAVYLSNHLDLLYLTLTKSEINSEGKLGYESCLIADDIVGSGKMMEKVRSKLLHPETCKFATLYARDTKKLPDYYVSQIKEWVVFPYELEPVE
jgi:hypoxanthine phosphoribosyltransferase